MVVVEGVCVAVMVVQWLWWRRVCSYKGGVVVVVDGVCSASMVVRLLWWRVCSCDGGTGVAVERACVAAL